MGFKISTALQQHLMGTDDLVAALDGKVFHLYGDPVSQAAADALIPANADAAIGAATLLCTVSLGSTGAGISFDPTPIDGIIYKNSGETWSGVVATSGYVSFYRLEDSGDTGALSTVDIRAQGTVGTLLRDLIVANAYLTAGNTQRIDAYGIGIPSE